ncbi:MAG: glycosyltransferase [Deltaproteobacteria bacterium]|nr:glycosyltransferase [Deltaproteobacteria bacterium]
MRVLFLVSHFPRPTIPLAGTWALEQAKALAEVVDLEVACLTPWVPKGLRWIEKARPWIDVPSVHRWGSVSVGYYKALYYPIAPFRGWAYRAPLPQMALAWASVEGRLLQTVTRFRPHVLFCHHTAASGYLASRIHALTGLPYVITDHDFDEITRCGWFPGRQRFYEGVLRPIFRHICVSSRMEADMRRLFPFVPTETLHNGVTPPAPERLRVPRPSSLDGKLVVFSAGMFYERKGFPLLVEAFARASARHPNAVLRIAGDGRERAAMQGVIAKHRLWDRVQLLGRVPHDDVFREMAWSDLFALVGWDESFGVVYLEAMISGKPIVACTDAGIADVVQDGVHGVLVPPRDVEAAASAIDQLLRSPGERLRMGRNAEALVRERLTWTANVRRLLEIFELSRQARAS